MSAKPGRAFHAGTILSVLQSRLVSPSGVAGVQALLEHMAGESLDLHQLERVAEECEASLAAQHPGLAEVAASGALASKEACIAWIAAHQDAEPLLVVPLAPDDHMAMDPATEAVARYGLPFRSRLIEVRP